MRKTPELLNLENLIKSDILSKFPLTGVTLNNTKFIPTDKVKSIETDGQNISYNPEYINGLNFDQQVFDFAHNLMHIEFNHIARSKDKDPTTWNYSTDAVINQILKHEGLDINGVDIPDAFNRSAEEFYTQLMTQKSANQTSSNNGQPSSKSKTGGAGQNGTPSPQSKANPNDKQQDSGNSESQSTDNNQNNQKKSDSSSTGSQSNNEDNQQPTHGSHHSGQGNIGDEEFHQNYPEDSQNGTGTENFGSSSGQLSQETIEDFEDYKNNGNAEQHSNWNGNSKKKNIFDKILELLSHKDKTHDYNEQNFTAQNQSKKQEEYEKLKSYIESHNSSKTEKDKKGKGKDPLKSLEESPTLEDYMDPVEKGYIPIVDWKKYLKRNKEIRRDEKLEYTWTRRRASEDSYWQSRLERKKLMRRHETDEKKPITLVVLDTSPSISSTLLRGFVNQLSELANESKILVGCFYDHFCGFHEVKPDDNGELYVHLERGWGTDLDAACRSFKYFERENPNLKILNRIIFTDGDYDNGSKPSYDLVNTDCLWLIFDYPGNFKCCCGQVMQFKSKDLLKDIKNEESQRPISDDKFILT